MRIGKRRGRGSEIAWGLLLVFGAALLILSKIPGLELPLLAEFTWLQIIVLVGCVWFAVRGLFKMEFFNLTFSLGIGYIILDKAMGWPEIDAWIICLAAAISAIGLHSIFRKSWKKGIEIHINGGQGNHRDYTNQEGSVKDVEYREVEDFEDEEDEDFPRNGRNGKQRYYGREVVFTSKTIYTGDASRINGEYVFSGVNAYIEGKDVESLNHDIVFSHVRMYFDKAQLHDNYAEMHTDVVFSTLRLYVPRDWNVIDDTGRVFGHHNNVAEAYREGAPTLCIKGDCVFGGVHVTRI